MPSLDFYYTTEGKPIRIDVTNVEIDLGFMNSFKVLAFVLKCFQC